MVKGFEQVLAEMARVEAHLAQALGSPIPFIDQLGRFLHEAKGKRLRPALAVLFYKLMGARGQRDALLRLAAVLELIHLATLVHDDVIDQAQTRRNQPALHVNSSNQVAVLEGDYLFVQVFQNINDYDKPDRSLIIETVERVLEGELLQESLRGQLPSEAQYDEVVSGKTASLIACACLVDARWGDPDLPEDRQQQVYEAGLLMGRAFQLVDDLLDVFGDETLGKPRWSDLRGGWLTLPMIRLAKRRSDLLPVLLEMKTDESVKTTLQNALDDLKLREAMIERAHTLLERP